MSKRILSLLLAVVMLLSVVPFQALAEDEPEAEATVVEETEAPVIPETTAAPEIPETTEAPAVPETTEAPAPETTAPTAEPTEAPAAEPTEVTEAPMEETEATEEATEPTVALLEDETAKYAASVGSIVTTPDANADETEREVLAGESITLTAKDPDDKSKVFLWKFVDPDDAGYARLTSGGILTPYPKAVLERRSVFVQAYNRDNEDETSAEIELILIPRVSRVTLDVNGEDGTNKEVLVNIDKVGEAVINAAVGPKDARPGVSWTVNGSESLYIKPDSSDEYSLSLEHRGKIGTLTVTATALDGSGVKAKTTIRFVKLATEIEIQNLPEEDESGTPFMIGGTKRTLTTNLATDKGLSDRGVIWQVIDEDADPDEDGNYPDSKYATIGENNGLLVTSADITEKHVIKVLAWVAADLDVEPAEATIVLYPGAREITAKAVGLEDNMKVELTEGTVELEAEIKPQDAMQNVTWTVNNIKLACFEEVNSEGKTVEVASVTDTMNPTLKLKAAGNVRITAAAKDGSGKKAYVNLKITAPVNELTITPIIGKDEDPDDLFLASGSFMNLKAEAWTVYDESDSDSCLLAENQKVTWSIGELNDKGKLVKTSAASVSAAGRVVAGTVEENTVVTVKAVSDESTEDNEISDTKNITITPKLAHTFAVFADGGKFSETQDRKLSANELLDAATDYQLLGKYYDRGEGEYMDIPATDCKYESSNPKIAKVDKYGNLTTGKSGSANIYVSWVDNADGARVQTVKITVKVQALVNAVEITTPKQTNVRSGSSLALKATAWNDKFAGVKAANQKFTWSVVDLDEDGTVKDSSVYATMSGSTLRPKTVTEIKTVRVFAKSAENGMTTYIDIDILPKAACQLTLSFRDMDGEEQTGTVIVPVNLMDASNLKLDLYQSIVSGNLVTVNDEKDIGLDHPYVTWSTSNKKIVEIVNGVPEFKTTGKVTLTAKFSDKANKQSATAKITLNLVNGVTDISIAPKAAGQELVLGRSLSLMATIKADNDGTPVVPTNRNVVWAFADSESANYATINPRSGVVTAKKGKDIVGKTVTVKAYAADGYGAESNELTLTICALAEEVTIDGYKDGDVVEVYVSDKTLDLSASVNPSDASQNVKWTSNNTSYASVDQDGKVTIKKGNRKVKITATATDGSGKKASITLDIKID